MNILTGESSSALLVHMTLKIFVESCVSHPRERDLNGSLKIFYKVLLLTFFYVERANFKPKLLESLLQREVLESVSKTRIILDSDDQNLARTHIIYGTRTGGSYRTYKVL